MTNERFTGPPPHVGWWQASRLGVGSLWRWWNGERWSRGVFNTCSATDAAEYAEVPTNETGIKWTTHWPAGARVPRIDPLNPNNTEPTWRSRNR